MAEQQIYHEKQSKMMCAVHALNNLLQDPSAFSKASLDNICYSLSPDTYINPHKNPLGLGNYDVNVLIAALALKDYETIWFDKRMPPNSLCFENILGFIINKPSSMNIVGMSLPIKRPHWFAVRKIGKLFYNLDSKLSQPNEIGEEDHCIEEFLTSELQDNSQTEIFIIIEKRIYESKAWKNNES